MHKCLNWAKSVAALAIAAGLTMSVASAATTLVVGKASRNADPVLPVDVGYQLGIFKKHGLDLNIVTFGGGSKMATAMAAGSIDIGDGSGTEMALVAKGVPMKAICESAGPVPFIAIGVPFDSPIHSVAQLQGKRIGFSSAGSLTDWLTRELDRKEGWGPHGVIEAAIGNGTGNIVSAFKAHLVDADTGDTSLFLAMEEKKTGRLLIPVSSYESSIASGALYASDRLIKTDPSAVRAFVAAWIETVNYMRAHKAETVKIEAGVTGFPESVLAKDYDITIGMFTKDCKFDAESIATLKRSFADLKLLPAAPDMSTLYTNEFMPQ
jgi:NitT/TauT family transport system substrate-binding protein